MKDNSNNFIIKLIKFIGVVFVGFFVGCAIAVIYSLMDTESNFVVLDVRAEEEVN